MALAVVRSRALTGMDAPEVTVEVHLANGLPAFNLVGLPEAEVKESRDRVRAAIQTAQFEFPMRKITVNLAPADLPKDSARFDLPIAIGLLAASGQIPSDKLDEYEFAGELSLTGELRAVRGALAMAWRAGKAGRTFVLPRLSAEEAMLVDSAQVLPADHLLKVCAHLAGVERLRPLAEPVARSRLVYPDLREVKGQLQAKRALEVCAAGQHSLLLQGPPGTGKSMLAQRLPGILPPMTHEEALESAAILSIAGRFKAEQFGERPYRAVHHTASGVALVGGGSVPRPGEISLAHLGTLFLDELPEFDRRALEVLREPLESGRITISRAARQADFPAAFQLIAAMNPCPCGYLGATNRGTRSCRCTPDQVARYRGKISGPLLDRIDLQINVPALSEDELVRAADGESSAVVRERVARAHAIQLDRQGKANSRLTPDDIDRHCAPDEAGEKLLRQAITRLALSARAYHRVLKVARTIADLAGGAGVAGISVAHIAEAIQYRRGLETA